MTDKNTLHVRGYVGISLLGRTAIWKKAEWFIKNWNCEKIDKIDDKNRIY
jgi:hypothetical protein